MACERANVSKSEAVEAAKAELASLRAMEKEQNEKLDVLMEQIGSKQITVTKPVQERLEELGTSIERLRAEIEEKEFGIEDLQKTKADPRRIATNLKGFAKAYEGLDAGDRQVLLRFMVRRIRITPTRMELELYDHETVIEDWDGGPDGWFRTALKWLPGPDSNQQPNG